MTRNASLKDHSDNNFQTYITPFKRFCRAQVLWRWRPWRSRQVKKRGKIFFRWLRQRWHQYLLETYQQKCLYYIVIVVIVIVIVMIIIIICRSWRWWRCWRPTPMWFGSSAAALKAQRKVEKNTVKFSNLSSCWSFSNLNQLQRQSMWSWSSWRRGSSKSS